ncbi:alanine racemase [Actinokineospora bangkokensis]
MEWLQDEVIDWRFKAVPHTLLGSTVRDALARRPGIRRDRFPSPVVALDRADLEHNLTTMADWCRASGLDLAPHGKTTMAPALLHRQLELGAWGITAATPAQARAFRAFGVPRVLLANEFVHPDGLDWVGAQLADPGFDFLCWADSPEAVRAMAGPRPRPLDVLVEVGSRGGRTGARTPAEALRTAEAIDAEPSLRLAGVGGYEAPAGPDLDDVRAYLHALREVAEALHPVEDMVVTAGGSAYFDLVASILRGPWRTVLRSGTYLTHDDEHYAGVSPLGDTPRLDAPALRSAWRVWAQVQSTPEPGLAILAAGKRDLPHDLGLPFPVDLDGEVTALNDQHAFLRTPAAPRVGEWVRLGISHPCTTFDKWSLLPVLDGDGETVVDLVRTFF